MTYAKDVSIVLTYSFILILFLSTKSFSAYLFFMTLWLELVVLVLFYVLRRILKKHKSKVNYISVLIGIIPLLLLNFVFFTFAGLEVDQLQLYELHKYAGPIRPIVYFKGELLVILTAILISYSFEYLSPKNVHKAVENMESNLSKQGMVIWILGLIAIGILQILPTSSYSIAIAFLLLVRMILELWFMRLNYSKKVSNK